MTKITDSVFIGNSQDARQPDSSKIDAVLNVAVDLDTLEKFKERYKVGLVDGPGNSQGTFVSAVLLLHSLVKENKRVLVHCHEGRSRSVMVVSSYLSALNAEPFDDTLKRVMSARGVAEYKPSMYDLGLKAARSPILSHIT